MQSVFNRIRHAGFIKYDYMPDFVIAIDELLEYFEENKEIFANKKLLLELCLFLINTISKTKYNSDDSNGEITGSFYTVVEFIEQNILEPNHELFSIVFEDLTNPKNKYDFELDKLQNLLADLLKQILINRKSRNI